MDLRICFVTPEYALYPPFGGIATHIRTMALWMARNGHDTHVVCLSRDRQPGTEQDDGVQVHFAAPKRIKPRRVLAIIARLPGLANVREAYSGWDLLENSLGAWLTVRSLERKAPFDVIQCGDYGGLAFWGVWPIKKKGRLLLRGQGLIGMYPSLMDRPGGRFHHLLERVCAQRADFILANSHYIKNTYSVKYRVASDRLGVLYRPYDFPDYTERIPTPTESPLILYVGRIEVAHKGVDILLDALHRVHTHFPNVRASFIGKVVPAMEERFGQFLQENQSWVTYYGPLKQSDVFAHMRCSSMLVLPSRDEAAGGVLVEAQFCGLPQIATRVGGSPELVQDGVTGLLVDPENSDALAEAILHLCTSAELRQQMGQRSREQARARFDIDATMTRYVRVLETLLHEGDPRTAL